MVRQSDKLNEFRDDVSLDCSRKETKQSGGVNESEKDGQRKWHWREKMEMKNGKWRMENGKNGNRLNHKNGNRPRGKNGKKMDSEMSNPCKRTMSVMQEVKVDSNEKERERERI